MYYVYLLTILNEKGECEKIKIGYTHDLLGRFTGIYFKYMNKLFDNGLIFNYNLDLNNSYCVKFKDKNEAQHFEKQLKNKYLQYIYLDPKSHNINGNSEIYEYKIFNQVLEDLKMKGENLIKMSFNDFIKKYLYHLDNNNFKKINIFQKN